MPLCEWGTSTIQALADAFLSSPRYVNPNTRRGYTGVLDRLLAGLGAGRPLGEVSGEELAGLLEQLWGQCAPATWNRNRGAVTAWLSWCAASRLPALALPAAPGPRDLCPVTGRARLGYDRARILFTRYTGWELHQLRHSAATHLGEQGIPLQLIMAKTRHRNPRTAMRYVRPGAEAVAEITALLEPPRRRG